MKRIFCILLCVTLLFLCSCSQNKETPPTTNNKTVQYKPITSINHYAIEPDDELYMNDKDKEYYKKLMDALLNRQESVQLCDDEQQNNYYIDLLKQSPYYFFASSCTLNQNIVEFEFAFTQQQQLEMLSFIDSEFLKIVNFDSHEADNTLDKILKVYAATASTLTYDNERTDNKQLSSPLFNYPADEIYKAFKEQKSLCYGFAYIFRFALLQYDIDCFCVYGPCSNRDEAHMWNIFKYNGNFYTCDSAWDRSDGDYPQLYHFGKTDAERTSDGLIMLDFSSNLFDGYEKIECTDDMFKIFRGVSRYYFTSANTYTFETFEGEKSTFNSQTFTIY